MSPRNPVLSRPVVAIVGATGAVGVDLIQCLDQRRFPYAELRLLASARSAGTVLPFGDREVTVEDAATADPTGLDIAVFSAGATTSRAQAPRFAEAGVTGGDVFGGLDGAEEDLGLGVNARRQLDAGDGEGGCVGRVAVDDAGDVRAGLVDREVHQDFAGALALA